MKSLGYLLIIFISSIPTLLYSQVKVKDFSSKEKPHWVLQQEDKNIVCQGISSTLEESKKIAYDSLKRRMEYFAIDRILKNNTYFKDAGFDLVSLTDFFKSSEYYQQVNEVELHDFYWENQLNKNTRKESFQYFIKYPMTVSELGVKIDAFASNLELSLKLDTLNTRIENFKSVDDLDSIWKELMSLNSRFEDSDERKTRCEELLLKTEGNIDKIEIKEMMNIPGKIIVTLTYNERGLEISKKPVFRSGCASSIKTEHFRDQWSIFYDYSSCQASKSIEIETEFETSYKKITQKFEVPVNQAKAEVKMSNTDIVVKNNRTITFFVSSSYRGNVVVDRITIKYNNLHFTDTPLQQLLDGPGLYDISFTLPPDFDKIEIEDTVRGELQFHIQKTGEKGVFKFYNHKINKE
ncbi:MAG: hypothetical protein JXA77_09775 [Bacteroidales bacterium]|nr:hypothetical protein [Bacteroidales bacterium]MBN2821433.1 hypothetical protein [Bacteroidales bacterium]